MIALHQGDCREIVPTLGVTVDAVVTDPPYHLLPTVQRFGADTAKHSGYGKDGSYRRPQGGFMGQQWDGGDIARDPATWAAIGSVLRPGGFLVAFGGTRTYHRLASAIEDAGFVIQDCLMWLYACLDEQTEVATAAGVMPHHKTKAGDLVLCYDIVSNEYSYQPILDIVEYDYADTSYRLIGDFGEQVVSRNHRCIVERGGRETFQYAETLECEARVPVLENLPELQAAVSDAHYRASKSQQNVRAGMFGGTDRDCPNWQGQAIGGTQGSDRGLRGLRQGDLEAGGMASEDRAAGMRLLVQWGSSGRRVGETRAQSARGMVAESEGRFTAEDDGANQPGVERWANLSRSEGSLWAAIDQICAVPGGVSAYGARRRICDGASPDRGDGSRSRVDAGRNSASPGPQRDRQFGNQFDAVRDQRTAQGIRAWRGHKTAVVRVVPFHYTGKVWCLRVPTGAFVAVRNGVAFPTGNCGFPKRRDMLKPAYEPIVLAYKPGGKRTMQVDECRIATGGETITAGHADTVRRGGLAQHEGWDRPSHSTEAEAERRERAIAAANALGRWPANICHDGSDEVVGLFPASGAAKAAPRGSVQRYDPASDETKRPKGGNGVRGHDDNGGSAARFFMSAKAGTQDRWGSRHPTVKPVELMKWLVALVTPPGGTVLDPFAGSGTTAVAALAAGRNAILVEREAAYVADIRERLAFYEGGGAHSMQAKHRNRKVDHGPLFAPQPLTAAEDAADSLASYNAAIAAIGERVKAGAPVPEFMLPRKAPP